ncbi:MAG: hypothetical protein GX813_00465 [Erysipelotrichia bacterium]|nr:hypothetical protein [Erysipelotrichia bacterium]
MNKKGIILSTIIACLSLAVMSLTASLAWYATVIDHLSISSLQMTIAGDIALRVSTSDNLSSFESQLTEKDFNLEGEDLKFSPVSTIYQDRWLAEKQKTPTFYDYSYYGATASGDPNYGKVNSGFFSRKIYLLSDGDGDYNVGLDINDSLFTNDEEANLKRAQQLYGEHPDWGMTAQEIKQQLDNLIKSLRISILIPDTEHYNFIIIDPTKGPHDKTLFGGLLDNNGNGFYDTYVTLDDNRREVIYGDVNDRALAVYNKPSNLPVVVDAKPEFFSNSFNAVSRGNAHTYNAEASRNNGLVIAEEPSTSLAELNADNPKFSIPCFHNEPREIILSIYLEGWDLDCINETMGASFITKLSFKLLGRII